MATFFSALYNKQTGSAGSSASSNYPLARDAGGKLRYLVVSYVCDGAEASGDTVTLAKLKVGAKVLPALSRVVSDTGWDISAMNVGIAGNTNKYANALDTLDTVSDISFGQGGDVAYTPEAITTAEGETIIATLTTVVTTTAGSVALFLIAYLDE